MSAWGAFLRVLPHGGVKGKLFLLEGVHCAGLAATIGRGWFVSLACT